MRVKLRPASLDNAKVRGWLRVDKEYVVLSIEALGPDGSVYRIESEDSRTPALFEPSFFELVDNSVPSLWIAVQQAGTPIQLMPATWAESGFWEEFFEGEPAARKAYEDAVRTLGK